MPYVLEQDESVGDGIKRIIAEKIQSELDNLREQDEKKRDQAILDARTSFKRIRAALRLIRKSVDEEFYQEQNIFYRDLARRLSPVRDAYVVIETLDKAVEIIDKPSIQSCGQEIRTLLVADYEVVRDAFWEQNIVAEMVSQLEDALLNIDTIKIKQSGFKILEAGLFKVYKRGYHLMAESYENVPQVEPFHEWRKWIKYLRYQIQILRNCNPEELVPYIKDIKLLADYLGDAHDFFILREHIAQFEETQSGAGRQLLAQLDFLRGQLEIDAKPLAESIYCEDPKKFVKRIRGYWKSWSNV